MRQRRSDSGDASPPTDSSAILTLDCATTGCHVGPVPPGGLVLADGFAYSYLVNVASSEMPSMKRVLMPSCAGSAPPGSHAFPSVPKPTPAEVDEILCWIETP